MRAFVNGDTMLDLQKKDGRFPLALQDVQWKEPQDIVRVFDLASGETVLEAKAVQELKAKACESTGPVVEIVDDEPSAKTATTEPMSRKRKVASKVSGTGPFRSGFELFVLPFPRNLSDSTSLGAWSITWCQGCVPFQYPGP